MRVTDQAAEEVHHLTDQALPVKEQLEIRGYQIEEIQKEENLIEEKTLIHMFHLQADEQRGHEVVLQVVTAGGHEVQ